jgi:hypothetical protein
MEEAYYLGIDSYSKNNTQGNPNKAGRIVLGDGEAGTLQDIFKEEGLKDNWYEFNQLSLMPVPKAKNESLKKKVKSEEASLVFTLNEDTRMANSLRPNNKQRLSMKIPEITEEDFKKMIFEKNYDFSLNRLTKLSTKSQILKLHLDNAKAEKTAQYKDPNSRLIVDTQNNDNLESNFVNDGPEAEGEQKEMLSQVRAAKEAEVAFFLFKLFVD